MNGQKILGLYLLYYSGTCLGAVTVTRNRFSCDYQQLDQVQKGHIPNISPKSILYKEPTRCNFGSPK
jgi:hypothetical protein